jgi:hypothetical protein
MGKDMIKYILGSFICVSLLTAADVTMKEIGKIQYRKCLYEINYPDGMGGTIKRLSYSYAESYFIKGVHQDKYYFIPLSEIDSVPEVDTIFFIGDNQTWSMQRLSCE